MRWGMRDGARGRRRAALLLAAGALVGACAREAASADAGRGLDRAVVTSSAPSTSSTVEAPAAAPPTAAPTTAAPAPPPTAPPPTLPPRVVAQPWVPYATVGAVTLHHPSDRVEAIGFHQSGHDGAQPQSPAPSAVRWFTMEDRDRDTHPAGAADIVIEPGRPVRAPVTGTVKRAGAYTLYCDHVDEYAVIAPDAAPGWEVKVLHVEGLALVSGQRVEAGVTLLAAHARVLPFPSQVEESTGSPPWPHVHVEVVDPAVPDRPTGPGCP